MQLRYKSMKDYSDPIEKIYGKAPKLIFRSLEIMSCVGVGILVAIVVRFLFWGYV